MQRTLYPLDSETRSKIRSTQVLTSIPQIVSELVQNSLDANSSHINVGVDVVEWECWVYDDGTGISKKDMGILAKGPMEGRYGSSKAYEINSLNQLSTFGFRGEALASAADICCLEISSRTKAAGETWSVIVKGGKSLHYGPAIRWRRDTPGSVVSVRDAFYNLPVRRRVHPSASKSLEMIKRDLQCFSLVFPHVSFTLEDAAKDQSNHSRGKVLSIPRTTSSLEAFRSTFGKPLAEHVHMIKNQVQGASIEGFISLEGASSKAYQFLYVNNRLLEPCDLHYVIDSIFSRSTFGKNAFEDDGFTTARQTARRSPRKNEKRPVYVLQLTLANETIDILLDPSKRSVYLSELDLVKDLLTSSVKRFLVQHSFMPPVKDRETDEDTEQEYDQQASQPSFKAAWPTFVHNSEPEESQRQESTGQEVFANLHDEEVGATRWENPRTGELFMIDNRTGHSERIDANGAKLPQGHNSRLCVRNEPPTDSEEQPSWIKSILTDWENPIFRTGERGIATHEMTDLPQDHMAPGILLDRGSLKARTRSAIAFTAKDLLNAEILGQVDRKFIACAIRDHSDGDMLLLVDQHAADERVRVERFLQEYCEGALASSCTDIGEDNPMEEVELSRLQSSKLVLLSKQEAAVLYQDEVRRYLRCWGIELEERIDHPAESLEGGERIQVGVCAVPELIEEKLLRGSELQEALKSIIGDIEVNGVPTLNAGDENVEDGAPRWLRAWRACPTSLLNLINSKACRGAIMFNDPLSMEQCSRLVLQLSQSVFPFQCAHGRPSVAPLVALDRFGEGVAKPSSNRRASLREVDWLKLKSL